MKGYKYDELTVASQDNAVKWFQEVLVEESTEESENIMQEFYTILENNGYEGMDIQWTFNNFESDGVAFYGILFTTDLVKISERLLSDKEYKRLKAIAIGEDFSIEIYNNNYNERNMVTYLNNEHVFSDYPKVWELLQKLERAVSEDIKEIREQLERQGHDAIAYYRTKVYAINEIRNCEYEFDIDGGRI
ncbi:hypothetical protein Blue_031 [Bacillus phage Deep Blue]|uniref:Uncharacterized protein n=1 Tax=Bacillus phage Deep Blue TaxID=1792245 RepID=A0A140HLJ2_9CAUD|nr:hypothetical protein Blue_031 [Bacillus phage Deep Blue]AMO25854.1 hypothetical protein Blue_031 [Bacillus phage Deep Blue]